MLLPAWNCDRSCLAAWSHLRPTASYKGVPSRGSESRAHHAQDAAAAHAAVVRPRRLAPPALLAHPRAAALQAENRWGNQGKLTPGDVAAAPATLTAEEAHERAVMPHTTHSSICCRGPATRVVYVQAR